MLTLERQSHVPLYLQIVQQIKSMVADGTLREGDRIPATRELAEEYQLHRNTVCSAYAELTADGVIQSYVGKGTFITSGIKQKPKENISTASTFLHLWDRLLAHHEKEDIFSHLIPQGYSPSTISFASAVPIADLFPFRKMNRVVNEIFRKKGMELVEFGEAQGYRLLRERLTEKMRAYGIKTTSEEILITNGCQQSLSIIRQALVKAGETVFIENPTYPGALRVFHQSDIKCLGIPVTANGLDMDVLENMLQRHRPALIYTTPAFHNPTGRTMDLLQRRHLLELAMRYGVPIVEDDIYSDLRYEGLPIPCLKSLDHSGAVIYLSSFSKIGFPGLRVGWLIAPSIVVDRLISAKEMQDLHTNVLGQAILAELVQGSLLTRHLKKARQQYVLRRDVMLNALKRYFPAEANWVKPEGGMSIWVHLPEHVDSSRVLAMCLQRGVVFSPGGRFFLARAAQNTMRLTFTVKDTKKIEDGISILGTVLKQIIGKSKQKATARERYRAALV